MTFVSPISAPIVAPIATPGGAVIPWYLLGGVTAAQCVAAYQPKGAADLAASYVNLNNPGTNNAAPGTAPTFDTATGWTFDGSTQWLNTGIVPAAGYSAIMRVAGIGATQGYLFGEAGGAVTDDFSIFRGANWAYTSGGGVSGSVPTANHVIAVIDGQKGYLDAVADSASATPGISVTPTSPIAIASRGGGSNKTNIVVIAFAVYNVSILSALSALTTAMAAL